MIDQSLLTQAIAIGTSFAFGSFQFFKDYLPTSIKAPAFIAYGTLVIFALYYGLLYDNGALLIVISAVSAMTGVTGGVNLIKEVKSDPQPV
jgi:asparagine N-glycosylation enzyme membrane subunit Stt3